MENMIEVKHLSFEYEAGAKTIEDISFTIPKGSYTTILGHNGSGKSTIAKLLIGLLEGEGEIIVDHIPLTIDTLYDVRSKVGIVFQNPDNQFIGSLSVMTLLLAWKIYVLILIRWRVLLKNMPEKSICMNS